MRELFVEKVIDTTEDFLDNNQRIKLKGILTEICLNYQIEMIEQTKKQETQKNNTDILNKFISSKEIEGCSTRTLNYYKDNINKMFDAVNLPVNEITTEILRNYLSDYKSNSNAGMVTIDNIRRTMATMAIDKGKPIEQVQKLLGHIKIDTTMEYAMVNQNNVKNSHRKYIT